MDANDTPTLVTLSGEQFVLLPVTAADEPKLVEMFGQVTPEELRFRFLSSVRGLNHHNFEAMIASDKAGRESLLVLNPDGDVIATGMLAGDSARVRGEVAVVVRSDHKGRGIGWALLEHLVARARALGYKSVESIEDRANGAAIRLEREMGFTVESIDDAPTLVRVRRTLS